MEAGMELVNRIMDAIDIRDSLPTPVLSGFRMAQDQKMTHLQRVPLLQECTSRQLREIARISEVYEAPAGTVLTSAGELGTEFCMILDGAARVEVPGGRGGRLGPGEFFGEMSLLDEGPRSATVVADTAIRLLTIKRRNFATLLKEAPALTLKILATLSRRVRQLEQTRP
jgi:CRP-like cAMP-binding protein